MKEYEQLKWICDKIGYNTTDLDFIDAFGIIRKKEGEVGFRIINVREIIFTQEFIDKYTDYIYKKEIYLLKNLAWLELGQYLDNPVEYLYNLLTN